MEVTKIYCDMCGEEMIHGLPPKTLLRELGDIQVYISVASQPADVQHICHLCVLDVAIQGTTMVSPSDMSTWYLMDNRKADG